MLVLAAVLALQAGPAPAGEAAKRFTLPDGFTATLFAGEPDLVQPLAFTIDGRGRVWVVETFTYPGWLAPGAPGNDRVSIFEDADGDGRFDSKKVFLEGVSNLSGIELGFGGVWLTQVPYLSFVPDADGDDVPDGPPVRKLDGFDLKCQHNVVNGLKWGPDGWLYGLNGILSKSRIGRPGTPDAERLVLDCGVWRFHPRTEEVEIFCWGTTNPFGLDFDERGELFFTNCVIKHAFHAIQGAHFVRMFGQDPTPELGPLMESPADHIHWGGGAWTDSRGGKGAHDVAGGGHAHAGAMIYLGDSFPPEYRGRLFTSNIHGNRINRDAIGRKGSGCVVSHEPDFFRAGDPWFRALDLRYGPDGAVYVSDWSDTGECHNYKVADRSNGRIYRIQYGKLLASKVDVAKLTGDDLVKLLAHPNHWHSRQALRILHERGAANHELLRTLLGAEVVSVRLRALWGLHAIGRLPAGLLEDPQEDLRAWSIRLSLESKKASPELLAKLADLAATDPSPRVRLALASGLQRLPLADRWAIGEALASRAEDAADPNLPRMVWYGLREAVLADPARAVALLPKTKLPALREQLARVLSSRR